MDSIGDSIASAFDFSSDEEKVEEVPEKTECELKEEECNAACDAKEFETEEDAVSCKTDCTSEKELCDNPPPEDGSAEGKDGSKDGDASAEGEEKGKADDKDNKDASDKRLLKKA
jgi:hypothetical protein